jgi:hypothetical protein
MPQPPDPTTAYAPDDVRGTPRDLAAPPVTADAPAAGRRTRGVLPRWAHTELHHALYLPPDWRPDGRYPVIVEYAGNGPYQQPELGDRCAGTVEDSRLGYGISAGTGFLWLCLPYVNAAHTANERQWWGDADATVAYCLEAVEELCARWGGDRTRLLLAGFSRGAIACNYLGLRDDRIAGLWRAFVAHSHYDGVRRWGYPGDDPASALERLRRLRGRPQFISHESSVDRTRAWLAECGAEGDFTFLSLPWRNHRDDWVLRPVPERRALRAWVARALDLPPGSVGGEGVSCRT